MVNGTVKAICISPAAGAPMHLVQEVEALAGRGLRGDRYCNNEGSFNSKPEDHGKRQVTLINDMFFAGSCYTYPDTRRNIVTRGVELMALIGKEFQIGAAKFRGVKYCTPCTRPNTLQGKRFQGATLFKDVFSDRAGLIAEVLEGGVISVGDPVVPPPRNY